MTPTFQISAADEQKFSAQLRQFSGKMNRDMQEVTRTEARLLLRDCINYTPPRVRGSNDFQTVAPRVQRKAADAQIDRETTLAFRPFSDVIKGFRPQNSNTKKVNYPRVRAFLTDYAAAGRLRAVQTILADFRYKTEVQSRATQEAYRARKRGQRRIVVMDGDSIAPTAAGIAKKAKARVGFGKSGWNTSARGLGLGGKVPGWVANKNGPGSFTQESTAHNFSLTLSNSVRHVQKKPDDIVGRALRRRVRSMEARMTAAAKTRAARA